MFPGKEGAGEGNGAVFAAESASSPPLSPADVEDSEEFEKKKIRGIVLPTWDPYEQVPD